MAVAAVSFAVLGAPPMAFGLIEGAAETIASFSRLLSGWLSDLTGRRKPLTAAGYTLANVVKPLLAVTQSWPQVFWIRFADRAAKGFRAAPRDALMADSVDPAHRGAAFGLRQAMDTAGAILGPPSAILLLRLFRGKHSERLLDGCHPGRVLCSSCVVRGEGSPRGGEERLSHKCRAEGCRLSARQASSDSGRFGPIRFGKFFRSLSNSARAESRLETLDGPGVGVLFNVVYAALSWPAGKLSDRVPRRWLVIAGYVIYASVYAAFAWLRTPPLVWFLFAIYGSYYALTEGVNEGLGRQIWRRRNRAPRRLGILIGWWEWQRFPPAFWPDGSGSDSLPPRLLHFPAFWPLPPACSCCLRSPAA